MLRSAVAVLTPLPKPLPVRRPTTLIHPKYTELVENARAVMPAIPVRDRLIGPLLDGLEKLNLGVYNFAKVERYLNLIKPRGTVIVWKAALTEASGMSVQYTRYNKPIPADALAVMASLQKEVSQPLDYFVSDYEERRPDPFLAVALREDTKDHYAANRAVRGEDDPLRYRPTFSVIYHWDEPGFGLL